MTITDSFNAARKRVDSMKAPGVQTQLALYALYKQATRGDVSGSRPGMLDIRGRAKYDAWAERRGMSQDAAMQAYIELVDQLAAVAG